MLALPLMLLAVFITAAILYYGIGYPNVFPWHTAILAGALLSATDPSSVVSVLKSSGAPERLITLLESESLFNDASAVVLFMLLVSMTVDSSLADSWQSTAFAFAKVFCGGVSGWCTGQCRGLSGNQVCSWRVCTCPGYFDYGL